MRGKVKGVLTPIFSATYTPFSVREAGIKVAKFLGVEFIEEELDKDSGMFLKEPRQV